MALTKRQKTTLKKHKSHTKSHANYEKSGEKRKIQKLISWL